MPRSGNRLTGELSPYLLQHAHNPVDWYPWGDEAFARAEAEDRPIFLSIGYATCHWCHVMERESFENEAIAHLLNEAFVCIKVDREERPDIDAIYMAVCQMMTGQGGWPLTIVMTPDRRPFYAATYIPPATRYGRIGMQELVPRIEAAWRSRRNELLDSAGQIVHVLQQQGSTKTDHPPEHDLVEAGHRDLMAQYDARFGGFGNAPKFPTPHRLVFLLRHGCAEGICAVEHTLEAMRRGGVFDHIGFGFHRYATDREWLLPHFEKMLYDQAMLATAYAEAFLSTGKPIYRQVAEEILGYVARDMTSPEGGFYSAEDADSEGEEGLFYVWDAAEMEHLLGAEYEGVARLWNILPEGNFNDESTRRPTGRNIPHLDRLPDPDDASRLARVSEKLFEVRRRRIHPLKDTKILADWNGLMIAAFAMAGRVFGEPRWVQIAERAHEFVAGNMRDPSGRLWHRYREGHTLVSGQLQDYAFVIHSLLELHAATYDVGYLEDALGYDAMLAELFADQTAGGYFMTAADAETLIVRPKEFHDGAIPSGNSVQLLNLVRLARLTGRPELAERAEQCARAITPAVARAPAHHAQALVALQFAEDESLEIVVVGERGDPVTEAMLGQVDAVHVPSKVVLLKCAQNGERLASLAPYTQGMSMVGGRPTAYVCHRFACSQPVTTPDELAERLASCPRRS